MNRSPVLPAFLAACLAIGCRGEAPSTPRTRQPAGSVSQQSRQKVKEADPQRLNYALPDDVPKDPKWRLRVELVHAKGQQIAWQTDQHPDNVRSDLERRLTQLNWMLSNHSWETGTAIVGRKGERKITFIVGQETDSPTAVILLLDFPEESRRPSPR